MDKFEYIEIHNYYRSWTRSLFLENDRISDRGTIDVLNQLGQEGWELVSINEDKVSNDTHCILKRKIS